MQSPPDNRDAGDQQHPLANYQFTPEELKVLKQCNVDSFFQRSLPIGTTLGVGTYLAVQSGFFKPSIRWGPAPKVIVGVIVGYFVGKFSYQSKCAEKLMQLPNSRLADMLKQRRKGGIYESLTPDQGFGAGLALAPFGSNSDNYSDEEFKSKAKNSLDIDTDRPYSPGLDDSKRPSVDIEERFEDDLPLASSKSGVTYDELRQKNRDEYASRNQNPYNRPIPREDSQPIIRSSNRPLPDAERPGGGTPGPKNKYGDTWTA